MKEFDFETRTQFKIRWEGKDYICTCPSQTYLVDWGKRVTELSEKNESEGLAKSNVEMFEYMGCPENVYKELEFDHIQKIMDFVGAKKN